MSGERQQEELLIAYQVRKIQESIKNLEQLLENLSRNNTHDREIEEIQTFHNLRIQLSKARGEIQVGNKGFTSSFNITKGELGRRGRY